MNVLDLLQSKGIRTRRVASTKGGEYASACPNCGDRSKPDSDRFRVWPSQNEGEGSYWCRGCDKSGDVVQFLIDFSGMTFKEACRELNRPLPSSWQIPSPQPKTQKPDWQPGKSDPPAGVDQTLWQKKAGKLVDWAHEHLIEYPSGMAWLEKRGIKQQTIKKFKLGWNPGERGKPAMFRPRESWGLPTILKDDGKKKKLWIPQGLVIPYLLEGKTQRIRIRRDGIRSKNDIKYYILPGSNMMPMVTGLSHSIFVVVESELDVILLEQEAGNIAGMIAMGSAAARPDLETNKILKCAQCILVAMDFDQAGAKAWQWWKDQFNQAERWPVPEGKDPGDAYQAGIKLKEWVIAGMPPAFRIGRSSLDRKKQKRPRLPNRKKPVQSQEADLPAPLQELRDLLQKYPVAIRAVRKRTTIMPQEGWDNWDVSKRISELVYFNSIVSNYLHDHPDPVIDKNNFLVRF